MRRYWVHASALMLALVSGCGSDDDAAGGGGGGGGTLTLSAANPASENTTLDVSKAAAAGNDARPADSFSAVPYCEIYAEGFPGANGRVYALQVYFRQSDKAALNVSLMSSADSTQPPSYIVFDNNSGNPITNVTVDTTAKTVTFNNKALAGSAGELGTLAGTVGFPANSTSVAACGV